MAETARTGAWGVLLVQAQLLSLGVDSAPMTTDSGIDLLAYDQKSKRSFSVQVKTRAGQPNERRPDWKVKEAKVAEVDIFAFVLKKETGVGEAWYLTPAEFRKYGQRQNADRALTFYRFNAPTGARLTESQMTSFKDCDGLRRFLSRMTPRMPAKGQKAKAAAAP